MTGINSTDILNTILDTRTKLPKKGNPLESGKTEGFRQQLRILDEQQAINRYKWSNLPKGLTQQIIERVLYYKGQGCLFYMEENETFYFLPYTLYTDGTDGATGIDCYGRYNAVSPMMAFGGSLSDEKPKEFLPGLHKKVIKEFPSEVSLDDFLNGCVILKDYTPQYSEHITPRQVVNEPIVSQMSEIFPIVRTNMYANSGVRAMRVNSEDEKANVDLANATIAQAVIEGRQLIPVVANLELQDLSPSSGSKAQELLMGLQALDNYRLSLYGLKNGGIFEKAGAYVNNTQAGNIQQNCGLQYQDGLAQRQEFCNIVNAVWGTAIWCDSSEVAQNMDIDFDGDIGDDEEPITEQGEENAIH